MIENTNYISIQCKGVFNGLIIINAGSIIKITITVCHMFLNINYLILVVDTNRMRSKVLIISLGNGQLVISRANYVALGNIYQ